MVAAGEVFAGERASWRGGGRRGRVEDGARQGLAGGGGRRRDGMAPVRIAEPWLGRTGSLQGVLSYSGPAMTRHSTAVGGTNGGVSCGEPEDAGV